MKVLSVYWIVECYEMLVTGGPGRVYENVIEFCVCFQQ